MKARNPYILHGEALTSPNMGGSFVRLVRSHLDGYSLLPYLTGQEEESPRKEAFYFSDDGDLTAVRYQDWKAVFMEQKTAGTLRVWMDPSVPLRVPLIFNLRRELPANVQGVPSTAEGSQLHG
jgi:arylsulfatase A-like enzyme